MKKPLVLCSILLLAYSWLPAQYYTLRSYEGKKVSLHRYYSPSRHELAISGPGNTLYLADYFGLELIRVVISNFLQISYSVRGGSNLGIERTVLLAVKGGRIRPAL